MRLLLLSRGLSALPRFLGPGARTLTYVDDAAAPLRDTTTVDEELASLDRLGYALRRVTLGDRTEEEVRRLLAGAEAVHLAGGYADALLAALRRSGACRLIADAVARGLPLSGTSAGAVVLGRHIRPGVLTDGPAPGVHLDSLDGLGLVDTVVVPHVGGWLPYYPAEHVDRVVRRMRREDDLTLLRDDQALAVVDGERRVVDS